MINGIEICCGELWNNGQLVYRTNLGYSRCENFATKFFTDKITIIGCCDDHLLTYPRTSFEEYLVDNCKLISKQEATDFIIIQEIHGL
jgi:hypothetical protein